MNIDTFVEKELQRIGALSSNTLYPCTTNLSELPSLSWKKLSVTPLQERTCSGKTPPTHATLVEKEGIRAWILRTATSIAQEAYGIEDSERPCIAFPHRTESMEKALWFYENNILPLVSSANPILTKVHMEKYKCDSFVGSFKTLSMHTTLLPLSITHIHIIDSTVDVAVLKSLKGKYMVSCTLALPEFGTLGKLDMDNFSESHLSFEIHKTAHIEWGESALATKLLPLPTPMLRYETSLHLLPDTNRTSHFTLHE